MIRDEWRFVTSRGEPKRHKRNETMLHILSIGSIGLHHAVFCQNQPDDDRSYLERIILGG